MAAGKNQYGAKTDFSNTSGCEATAKFLKAVWAELLKMLFYPGRIYLSEGLYRCIFIFHETYGRSSLAQYQVARSGTRLWQVCNWSWRMLSDGSARTRDQSDLRKIYIHFGRRNETAEMAATRTLPPCRLSTGVAFTPTPVRLRQISHKRIVPKKPTL